MRFIKSVKQTYSPAPEILELLEIFRCMVNDCIRIGLETKVTSRNTLSTQTYHQLAKYDAATRYRLTAISKATGLLKNYRKILKNKSSAKPPYVKRAFIAAHYGIKIENGKFLLPIKSNGDGHLPTYIFIPLTAHTLATIGKFHVRSVTLTSQTININYSREVVGIVPAGYIGVDRNLNNVTIADTNGHVKQLDLSEATKIKAQCRKTRRNLKRYDTRIRSQVFSKYGRIERNRVQQILHHASKQIVQAAKRKRLGIVMEDLKDIRKLYRKGNWQGREFRGKLNGWSYGELQRQIQYKAEWEGLPVIYVNPWGTSSKCAKCGSRLNKSRKPEERRTLECSQCGVTVDRDTNAALNLAARGLRFKPVGLSVEAVVAESRSQQVIRKVDDNQLAVDAS